jgi:hypothetical protein
MFWCPEFGLLQNIWSPGFNGICFNLKQAFESGICISLQVRTLEWVLLSIWSVCFKNIWSPELACFKLFEVRTWMGVAFNLKQALQNIWSGICFNYLKAIREGNKSWLLSLWGLCAHFIFCLLCKWDLALQVPGPFKNMAKCTCFCIASLHSTTHIQVGFGSSAHSGRW